jgi:hypothetical protein
MSDDPILAALARLEAGQTALRVDFMARMDRLQARVDSLDDHLTLVLGHSDRVERRAQAVSEDNRLG